MGLPIEVPEPAGESDGKRAKREETPFLHFVPENAEATVGAGERRVPEIAYEQLAIAADALRQAFAAGLRYNMRSRADLREIDKMLKEFAKEKK